MSAVIDHGHADGRGHVQAVVDHLLNWDFALANLKRIEKMTDPA